MIEKGIGGGDMISNLDYCRVFYAVAQNGSITLAAHSLYISQPAVSQCIRQLEKDLGCRLFSRSTKGVSLTPEGAVFYESVKKGYEEILAGEKKLHAMLNLERGELRIGASDMTLQFYLLPYLERFHKQFPDVKINVSNAPTPETLRLLKSGGIDFGIVSTPFEADAAITSVQTVRIRDVFVAGEKFRCLQGKTVALEELEQLPVICLEKSTSTRRHIDEFLRENGVVLAPEIELATSELIVEFARRDLGIGVVMRDFAEKALAAGELFELELSQRLPPRSICVVTAGNGEGMSVAAKQLYHMLLPEQT